MEKWVGSEGVCEAIRGRASARGLGLELEPGLGWIGIQGVCEVTLTLSCRAEPLCPGPNPYVSLGFDPRNIDMQMAEVPLMRSSLIALH